MLDELYDQGLPHADPNLARLMIIGAMNFSATSCRSKSRSAQRVDLDQWAAQEVALVLHPK